MNSLGLNSLVVVQSNCTGMAVVKGHANELHFVVGQAQIENRTQNRWQNLFTVGTAGHKSWVIVAFKESADAAKEGHHRGTGSVLTGMYEMVGSLGICSSSTRKLQK